MKTRDGVERFSAALEFFFPCLHSLVKTEANVWKNSRAAAREFSQILPRFSTGYGGTKNMFYFFYKIIFSVNKEKDDTRSAYCKFSQLGDSQTTLLTPFSYFIALQKHTCGPMKTHVLSKLCYEFLLFYSPKPRTQAEKPEEPGARSIMADLTPVLFCVLSKLPEI